MPISPASLLLRPPKPRPTSPRLPVLAGAGCAALRTADHAQQARGRPDLVPSDVYVVGLIVAWHPLLWWACGGRWGAVLGERLAAVGGGRESGCRRVAVSPALQWGLAACCSAGHVPMVACGVQPARLNSWPIQPPPKLFPPWQALSARRCPSPG